MAFIKKYNQYIKENKNINEDFGDEIEIPGNEMDIDNPVDQTDDMPEEDIIPSELSDEMDEEGEEEEGHQYVGSKMLAELADKLGVDVVNNSIDYNGKKINFFSETEMYHVDRKKFKTADEVVEYLGAFGGDEESDEVRAEEYSDIEADEEADMMKNDEILRQREEPIMSESKKNKSYRTSRTFESFKSKK